MHRLEVPDGISSHQAGRVLKGVIHIRQPGRRDARLRCIRALPLTFLIREGIMRQQGGSGFTSYFTLSGGSNPSCLAMKWSEKRKIMIGLSRMCNDNGMPHAGYNVFRWL